MYLCKLIHLDLGVYISNTNDSLVFEVCTCFKITFYIQLSRQTFVLLYLWSEGWDDLYSRGQSQPFLLFKKQICTLYNGIFVRSLLYQRVNVPPPLQIKCRYILYFLRRIIFASIFTIKQPSLKECWSLCFILL